MYFTSILWENLFKSGFLLMNYARKVLSYQKNFPLISFIIFEKWSKLAATFHVLSYTVTLLYRLRVTSDEQFLNQLESRSDFAIEPHIQFIHTIRKLQFLSKNSIWWNICKNEAEKAFSAWPWDTEIRYILRLLGNFYVQILQIEILF